jgi:hypothetical protein
MEERTSWPQGMIEQEPRSALLHVCDGEGERDDKAADKPTEKHRAVPTRGGIWDVLSVVAATASLLALAAVLCRCDNKPTPDWYLGVTLNAILSILSTMFKGSLLVSVTSSISQFGWLCFTRPRPLRDVCDSMPPVEDRSGILCCYRDYNSCR